MTDDNRPTYPMRRAQLAPRKPTRFDLRPPPAVRQRIAKMLDLIELPKLRMRGEFTPKDARDFKLIAQLDARAVQPCVSSLAPVPCEINEEVRRLYLAEWEPPQNDELQLSDEDDGERLPEVIELADVMIEALTLALPLYPRAAGVTPTSARSTPPGAELLSDDEAAPKPFAALAALRESLAQGGTDKDDD